MVQFTPCLQVGNSDIFQNIYIVYIRFNKYRQVDHFANLFLLSKMLLIVISDKLGNMTKTPHLQTQNIKTHNYPWPNTYYNYNFTIIRFYFFKWTTLFCLIYSVLSLHNVRFFIVHYSVKRKFITLHIFIFIAVFNSCNGLEEDNLSFLNLILPVSGVRQSKFLSQKSGHIFVISLNLIVFANIPPWYWSIRWVM